MVVHHLFEIYVLNDDVDDNEQDDEIVVVDVCDALDSQLVIDEVDDDERCEIDIDILIVM